MKQYIIDINDTPLDFSTNNNMTNEELEAAIEKLDAEILASKKKNVSERFVDISSKKVVNL